MYGENNIPLETKMNKALLDVCANPSDSLLARIEQIKELCVNYWQKAKIGYVENQYLEKFGTPDAQSIARQNLKNRLFLRGAVLMAAFIIAVATLIMRAATPTLPGTGGSDSGSGNVVKDAVLQILTYNCNIYEG